MIYVRNDLLMYLNVTYGEPGCGCSGWSWAGFPQSNVLIDKAKRGSKSISGSIGLLRKSVAERPGIAFQGIGLHRQAPRS